MEKLIFQQLAEVRGEAMAARLLVRISLDYAVRTSEDREKTLAFIINQIDRDLNAATFSGGDDELNDRARETARFHAHEVVDDIRRNLPAKPQSPPS